MTPRKRHRSARLAGLFTVLMTLVVGSISFTASMAAAAPSDDFVYTVTGTETTLPFTGTGYTVTYTDAAGVEQTVPAGHGTTISLGGAPSDSHEIRVSGDLESIRNVGPSNITDIKQWGSTAWTSLEYAFQDCTFTDYSATDAPNLTGGPSLAYMFTHSNFNGDVSNWDTSKVTNMHGLFYQNAQFNQPLNNWNVSNVTDMQLMFGWAEAFNQPLDKWDTSKVTDMTSMFYMAGSFNQPVNDWNTSSVTSMWGIFSSANAFNQPLGKWDTSKVSKMDCMFCGASAFNQPLDSWNTSNVTSMHAMFGGARAFDQSLAAWDISKVASMTRMLEDAGLSMANYDATLIAWSGKNVQPNVPLGALGLIYSASNDARQSLIDNHGWIIAGDFLAGGSIEVVTLAPSGGAKLTGAEYDVFDSTGKFITHIVADANAVATAGYLPLGEYRIVQVKAPDGYASEPSPIMATITTHREVVQKTFTATPATARIQVVKADPVNGIKLAGAEYDILDPITQSVVAHIVTGNDGVATSGSLRLGNYTVVETKPPTGYAAEPISVPATLTTHGQIFQVILDGTVISGRIEITKTDSTTGAKLSGAEYDIIDSAGRVAAHVVTRSDGVAITANLPRGDYRIVETRAPDGYILETNPVLVSITAHGQVVQRTVNGTRITVGVTPVSPTDQVSTFRALPATGAGTSSAGALALLVLGSVTAVILGRRREARNS